MNVHEVGCQIIGRFVGSVSIIKHTMRMLYAGTSVTSILRSKPFSTFLQHLVLNGLPCSVRGRGKAIYLVSTAYRPAAGPTQSLFNGFWGLFSTDETSGT